LEHELSSALDLHADAVPEVDKIDISLKASPLWEAKEAFYQRMPLHVRQKHEQHLYDGCASHHLIDKDLLVGSACTGSDIDILCMQMLMTVFSSTLGLSIFLIPFSASIDIVQPMIRWGA
jgi:hypothetical protein